MTNRDTYRVPIEILLKSLTEDLKLITR